MVPHDSGGDSLGLGARCDSWRCLEATAGEFQTTYWTTARTGRQTIPSALMAVVLVSQVLLKVQEGKLLHGLRIRLDDPASITMGQ